MGALSYLLRKQFKNSLLTFIKQPSKLILGIVLIGLLVVSVIPTNVLETENEVYRNISELYAGIFVLFTAFYILMAYKGFGSGASMYSMADVNLLFETPIKPTRILSYGLLRQIGTALLVCFFIIYQYATLHNTYGISFGFVILILLCFAAVIMCGQMTAMLIYSKTSADDEKKKKWRVIFYGVFIILIGIVVYKILSVKSGNLLADAISVINSDLVSLFPISGWMKAVTLGIGTGSLLPFVLGIAATLAFMAVIVMIIAKSKTDYYEDVLAATEVAHNVITSRKEGKMNEIVPKNIKVGKTGIGAGSGATAIYFKQKLERRRGRFLVVDMNSLVFIVITIAVALFVNMGITNDMANDQSAQVQSQYQLSSEDADPSPFDDINPMVITALAMSVYMQMFTAVMGRFVKELALPYIYMIPEPPFKKLVNCLKENITSLLAEGILLWIPLMFIAKLDTVTVLFCILSRISFGYLFISSNIFLERFMGGLPKVIGTMMYFILAIVMALPGIIVGIITGTMVGASFALPIIPAVVFVAVLINFAVTALTVFASRNMLVYAELNNT